MEKPKLIKKVNFTKIINNEKKYYYNGIYECPICGIHFETTVASVKNGHAQSCGNHYIRGGVFISERHHGSKTRLYKIYRNIKLRCYYPKSVPYKHYGGRGIKVCSAWNSSFFIFRFWALMHGYEEWLEIDRIDVNGDYKPSNCRWVTKSQNRQNTRLLRSDNKSGYRGVSFHIQHQKWQARVMIEKIEHRIGLFDDPKLAAQAVNEFIIKNGTAHPLNIIE